MAQVLVEEQSLSDTAAAIRSRLGGQDTYKPREFAAAINSIVDYATVTQTLTGASSSTNATKVAKGDSFYAEITPTASDYKITSITVTMGGTDITSQVFKPGVGAKSITTNGTYTAAEDNLSGYDTVTVAVPTGGGGTPSATQHSIYFEFTDSTNTTITGYWDDSFISNAITATTPTTYGGKTVSLAQLDGVTWYEPSDIPLNTELVDYTKVMTEYVINDSGAIESTGQSWDAISDYIPIDPSMTFTFKTNKWYNVGFYNSSKNMVRVVTGADIETSSSGDVSLGTLNASNIPSTAAYVILAGNAYNLQGSMSLIRTA